MRGRRLWLKAQTITGVIPVYVVKELVDDNGDDIDGVYWWEAPHILIRQQENMSAMKQTLHHELMHVAFRHHSGTTRTAVLGSKTADGRYQREEDIVSFLEPLQFDLLVRNGWLKYPNPPKVK